MSSPPSSLTIHRAVLPSGLRALVLPMAGTSTVAFFLVIRTGSRHETPALAGISHFLEHLFFKGSEKRPTTRAIAEAVDRVGGETNACTAKEWTAFYAKAASRHAALLVDVISDMVLRPLLDSVEIDRERGVIIEEINMYEDTPMRSIGEFFEETLFGRHALAHPIIGAKDNIRRFPRETIVRYFQRQYRARSAVVCLAGDLDPRDGVKILRTALRDFPRGRAVPPPVFRGTFGRQRLRLKTKKTDQTHVLLGVPGVPFLHRDYPALHLAAAVLGGGMSSRLFLEVRERRGLAYAVRTASEYFVDAGYVGTQMGVDSGKFAEACRVVLREHARLREKLVGRAELNKAREFIKGKLLLSLEASDDVAQFAALQEALFNRILMPDVLFRLLDAVEPADLQRVAKTYLQPEQFRLVAIGPELREGSLQEVFRSH